MSGDLSGLNLSMVNEEELRIQVAATVSSRADRDAVKDQDKIREAWATLQAQERAMEALEAALLEAKRARAESAAVVILPSAPANRPGAAVEEGASQKAGVSIPQLEFQLARARRELKRAGTALDDAQKAADANQRARYEAARQRELAASDAQAQAWSPATSTQAAFAGLRAGVRSATPSSSSVAQAPHPPQPLTFAQTRRSSTASLAGDAASEAGSTPRASSLGGRSSVTVAPARRPLSHLRGITRESYTGGDVLPSLTRVHVSRADIRAKHLRYEDDGDVDTYHSRVCKRQRLELVAALQEYAQRLEEVKAEEVEAQRCVFKSDASQSGAVKTEPPVDNNNNNTSATSESVVARVKIEPGTERVAAATTPANGAAAAKPIKSEPETSLTPSRMRSSSGYEVIDVDNLMEEEGAETQSGQPLLHELLALIAASSAESEDDKVKTEAALAACQEHDSKKNAKAKGASKKGGQKRTHRDDDDDVSDVEADAYEDALWERADALVAGNPSLTINQRVQVIPGVHLAKSVYDNLLDYQQEGLRWLLHLHGQRSGGILGDEMGLGKTIQIAAMLNALHASKQLRGPALIIAPTTVLRQWVAELHRWAPYIRACVMHESAGDTTHITRESLLKSVRGTPAVVVTTYAALRTHCELLHGAGFQYLIVDEGHKLSNPEAAVTLAAKSFPTPHRLVLSGSPIQNSLKELWCLFDFVRPGLLGTLGKFVDEFETPISQSKNVRATPLALATAMECAKTLQAHIAPYLLRRLKRHVNASLPPKTERVIRVPLSDEQLAQYVEIVSSPGVQRLFSQTLYYPQIAGGPLNRENRDASGSLHVAGRRFNLKDPRRRNTAGVRLESFRIMNQLRQVCNHSDIYAVQKGEHDDESEELKIVRRATAPTRASHNAGSRSFRSNNPVNFNGSAKLGALQQMLREWHRFGHRVLVFSQTRMMLDIIENLCEQENHRYIRMDGTTNSHHRQELIDRFNGDDSIFVALLTTRVGGIGVNLIGADRVVIFDPDWNPVTDIQARERAWRIGQTREVCVYRMISSGTVEEAILRRQLAKTYVTDKVLRDPTLQRFFHVQDSFVENFLLGPEYESRVPLGKKHVLGGVGVATPFFTGHVQAVHGGRRGDASTTATAAAAPHPRPAPLRQPALFADDAGGEQEIELLRDDVNDASSPTTLRSRVRSAPPQPQARPSGNGEEEEFGVVVHVTRGDDDEAGDDGANDANDGRGDGGETSLLKKLMDGKDVSIDGKDAVSRSLAQAKARSMMQRVVQDGHARDASTQQREFSLLWAAQKKKEKDSADSAEQSRYFQEELARKRSRHP